jgi:ubiquinone biosynthesis accessory factor UbiK
MKGFAHYFRAPVSGPAREWCGRVLHSPPPRTPPQAMTDKRPLDELGERISEALRNSPAQDLEKNLRAMLVAFFDRFDLVAREDFEVQRKLLERAQAKLAALEARLAALETRRPPAP